MAKKIDRDIEPITDGSFDEVVDKIFDVRPTKTAILKTLAGSSDRPLKIGSASIDCFVLEDETRVLSQRGMFKGLGVARGGPRNENEPSTTGAEIPRFASQNWLKPYINSDLEVALKSPIFFQPPTGHGVFKRHQKRRHVSDRITPVQQNFDSLYGAVCIGHGVPFIFRVSRIAQRASDRKVRDNSLESPLVISICPSPSSMF